MQRREFIAGLAAGSFSGVPESVPSTTSPDEDPELNIRLRDLLPSEEALPPQYELSPFHEPMGRESTQADVPGVDHLHSVFRRREYRIDGDWGFAPAEVEICARMPITSDGAFTTADLDLHHQNVLRSARGGQAPSEEKYNDWFDVQLSESKVDGHQQTLLWYRKPQVRQRVMPDYPFSDKPYQEYALLVRSTDWGLIKVEAHHRDEESRGRQRRLVHRLLADIRNRAALTEKPIVERPQLM